MLISQAKEHSRLGALHRLGLLDSPREERFDRLTRLAAEVAGTPIALITLVDASRTWGISCFGLAGMDLPADDSFCRVVARTGQPLVVEDACRDARFAGLSVVTGAPFARFYAGFPLHAPGGEVVGALCAMGAGPRALSPGQASLLADLALLAEDALQQGEREREARVTLARLDEVERLKADFLNATSHELRTPLASIVGYTEFLEDEIAGELNAAQREFVSQLQAGADRLTHLVDDLLDFARLGAGTFRIAPRETSLDVLVQAEVEALRPKAELAEVSLSAELPPGNWVLELDPGRTSQALRHLLGNALKFTGPGGSVRLALTHLGHGVVMAVEDTGIGIASEHLPHLFEKFYQVDPSPTRSHGGAGLGLALVQAVANAHGGCVGVESELGQGSRFWLTLPVRRHAG